MREIIYPETRFLQRIFLKRIQLLIGSRYIGLMMIFVGNLLSP